MLCVKLCSIRYFILFLLIHIFPASRPYCLFCNIPRINTEVSATFLIIHNITSSSLKSPPGFYPTYTLSLHPTPFSFYSLISLHNKLCWPFISKTKLLTTNILFPPLLVVIVYLIFQSFLNVRENNFIDSSVL